MFSINRYSLHKNLYLDTTSIAYQLEQEKEKEKERRKRKRVPKPPANQMSFDDLITEDN